MKSRKGLEIPNERMNWMELGIRMKDSVLTWLYELGLQGGEELGQ